MIDKEVRYESDNNNSKTNASQHDVHAYEKLMEEIDEGHQATKKHHIKIQEPSSSGLSIGFNDNRD